MFTTVFQSAPEDEEKTKDDGFVEDASDIDARALALKALEGRIYHSCPECVQFLYSAQWKSISVH